MAHLLFPHNGGSFRPLVSMKILLVILLTIPSLNVWAFNTHFDLQFARCPNDKSFVPCQCNSTTHEIICGAGITDSVVIRYIFQESSPDVSNPYRNQSSHYLYSHLILENSPLDKLINKSLENFNFIAITIRNHYYLSTIELDAFATSNLVTKVLKFDNNPNLGATNESVYSLFGTVATFPNLETLIIHNCGLGFIPSNAFETASSTLNIRRLSLMKNQIKVLYPNAFSHLPNLRFLYLNNNNLEELHSHSLYLKANRCRQLKNEQVHYFIDLNNNHIDSQSFHPNSIEVDCSTELNLSNNSISYLPEDVFKPLFAHYTKILLYGNRLDCNHCNMSWLLRGHFCSTYNSTFRYQSLIESVCESMDLSNFIQRCQPFVGRLQQHKLLNKGATPADLVAKYLEFYPEDFKESNRNLLRCPDGSNGVLSRTKITIPVLTIVVLLAQIQAYLIH